MLYCFTFANAHRVLKVKSKFKIKSYLKGGSIFIIQIKTIITYFSSKYPYNSD